jgi:hypothetical protein
MANSNNPFGFRPIIRAGGSPFSVTEYGKAAADANAIFVFDLVGHITGGTPFALPENSTYNLSRIQSGSQLTPGTSLWLGASLSYGAASTGTVHPVCDELDCIFIAQCSGATSITTASHAGLNANVKLTQAGSTTTKQSGEQVDSATIAATSSLDLRITRIAMIVPNAEGANAIVEVLINKHAFGQGTTAT